MMGESSAERERTLEGLLGIETERGYKMKKPKEKIKRYCDEKGKCQNHATGERDGVQVIDTSSTKNSPLETPTTKGNCRRRN